MRYREQEWPQLPDCPECGSDNVTSDMDECQCMECEFIWTPLTGEDHAAIQADWEYDCWKDRGGLLRYRH